MADANRPRIFQIGFNRCGTKSLSLFFERQGFKVAHWKGGTVAASIELARRQAKPLLHHVPQYDVYTDMEKINISKLRQQLLPKKVFRKVLAHMDAEENSPICAFKYFRELDEQYPGSRFILNTRSVDRWVQSRLRFNDRKYRSCIHGDEVHHSEAELGACWEKEWHDHHEAVRRHFDGRPADLLTLDIESDGGQELVDFFGDLQLQACHWGKSNVTS